MEERWQSMQEKEVALRYRLQMAAITQTEREDVASEVREREVEKLRDIATTEGILLRGVISERWWRR